MSTSGTRSYHVYILTNKNKTVLYTGISGNLKVRLHEHANPEPGAKHFTTRYNCFFLLYYEQFLGPTEAIRREKQIKGYSRAKKEALINAFNPKWEFLNDTL